MAVPYSFATRSGQIPLSELDADFAAFLNKALADQGSGLVGHSSALGYSSGYVGAALIDRGVCITDYPYLADPSGTADSTTAIQTALNNHNTVYIPDGTFLYSSLTLNNNNNIRGTGTLKRITTTGIPTGEQHTITALNVSNWSISGITLDGNKAGQSGSAGFKVSGILVRGCSNYNISFNTFQDWHEDCIEITCAAQSAPVNAYTAPAAPSDTIYRGRIIGNLFKDSGRNVNDGSGYSDSRCVQIGSKVVSLVVTDNVVWNCIGGFQAGAYNDYVIIANNTGFCDSSTLTFAGDFIAVEQLSTTCSVTGNIGYGWLQGANIESAIGGNIAGNQFANVRDGISIFASSALAIPTDVGELTVSGNRVVCRDTSSGSFAIRVTVSSGHAAYNVTVTGNNVQLGEKGIQLSGLVGGCASGNYANLSKTGFDVTACTEYQVVGNHARRCTAEGFYFGASNNGVTASANTSKFNGTYGCDVAASQTDLRLYDNDWAGSNGTVDFRITTFGNVSHDNNRYNTHSGTIKTLSGATPSVQFVGPTSYFTNGGATTVTALTGGRIGEVYRFVATNGNTTLQHGTNIFMRSHANFTMAANDAITLTTDDGTHFYEC